MSKTNHSTHKSPFLVIQDFLSPKQADYIVDTLNIVEPDTNHDEKPIKTARFNHHCETLVFSELENIKAAVEEYYGLTWKGTEQMTFEFFPEDCANGLEPTCSNSVYTNRKWVRNKPRDLTGVIFLSDYNTGSDEKFDPTFEVYGGKLQFPQYDFSFHPQRGTFVIFPAGPQFIHAVSKIEAGDLFMVRFHICADQLWPYDRKDFPGSPASWFSGM